MQESSSIQEAAPRVVRVHFDAPPGEVTPLVGIEGIPIDANALAYTMAVLALSGRPDVAMSKSTFDYLERYLRKVLGTAGFSLEVADTDAPEALDEDEDDDDPQF